MECIPRLGGHRLLQGPRGNNKQGKHAMFRFKTNAICKIPSSLQNQLLLSVLIYAFLFWCRKRFMTNPFAQLSLLGLLPSPGQAVLHGLPHTSRYDLCIRGIDDVLDGKRTLDTGNRVFNTTN
jgi:hypothetical protein